MKKPDIFTTFEIGTYALLGGALAFGIPAGLAFFLADWFLPSDWPAPARYGLAAGCAVLAFVAALPAMAMVEDFFPFARRVLRMRRLDDVLADVEHANAGTTFVPEPTEADMERRRRTDYGWVAKYQLVAAFFMSTLGVQYWTETGGWGGALAVLASMGTLYWCVSAILDRVSDYTDQRRRELEILKRQLVLFSCALHNESINPATVKRLLTAASPPLQSGPRLPQNDDWALINRAWTFWDQGLEEQDRLLCANCGSERQQHRADGRCPTAA